MRGIDRFLAGILLAGAVGGVAIFARSSGNDSSARAIDLAAPPLQHIGAPGTVLFAHTPAPTRVVVRASGRIQVRQAAGQPAQAATAAPDGLFTTPQAAPSRPVTAIQPRTQAPTPTPTPAPAPVPVPTVAAPVPAPQPPRALAAVQIAPTPSESKGKGHGRALGHDKQHGHDTPQNAEDPAPPVPMTTPVPQLAAVDPSQTGSDDGTENGDTTGPGNGHGHAWGHSNGRATPDAD